MKFEFILITINPSDKNPSKDPQNPESPRTHSGRTCFVSRRDRLSPSPPLGGPATASCLADAVPADAVVVLQPFHHTNRPWNKVTASGGRAHHPIHAAQVPTHPDHLFESPNMFGVLATRDEDSQPGSLCSQELLTPMAPPDTSAATETVPIILAMFEKDTVAPDISPPIRPTAGEDVIPTKAPGHHPHVLAGDSNNVLYKTLCINQPDVTLILHQQDQKVGGLDAKWAAILWQCKESQESSLAPLSKWSTTQ
jgi:hypothetical protein